MTRRLVVLTAGLSDPSSTRLLADRLAEASATALREHGEEAAVETIELRPLAHDLANHLLTGFANGALAAAQRSLAEADGVIAVTPVFTASYSGLFKTFLDVLEPGAMAGTPVLIGATAGTARHSLVLDHALRPVFAYLKAVVVPTGVFAASEDWGLTNPVDSAGGDALGQRVQRAGTELASLVAARPAAPAVRPVAAFGSDVPDFETLLRGR